MAKLINTFGNQPVNKAMSTAGAIVSVGAGKRRGALEDDLLIYALNFHVGLCPLPGDFADCRQNRFG
jgi:hypothetical protein